MNEHALRVLEFDRLLDLLCRYAGSGPGAEAIRSLRPSLGPGDTAADSAMYEEAASLRRDGLAIPAARFESPEEWLARAAPEDSVIETDAILGVFRLLQAAGGVRMFLLGDRCERAVQLRALAAGIDPCADFCRRVEATFEGEDARVRDTATERLGQIRSRILSLRRRIEERLDRMLSDPSLSDVFTDRFVTIRHGRHVVPVDRELRGRVRGIVHDQSNSGATLFVEPEEVVEWGNELELMHSDERAEVRRIMQALTAAVRQNAEAVRADFAALVRYDAAFAVSAWAVAYDCRVAAWGDRLALVRARHPLLQHRLEREGRGAELVPLDLETPEGANVVVITGSNTGGKTVALKTVGLLTAMAQCGLPIPADAGTRMRVFDDILADIGDEQSIEQSLSTFSAHMERIVETLDGARAARALVLLDELGAGTDPVEGGALACAILDALTRAPGLTLATTHLGAVKRHVHGRRGMANASMVFDIETLRPQYRLTMGRAGASYALAVAERRGVPAAIIEAARALLSEGDRNLEDMLTSMDRQQIAMEREVRQAEDAKRRAEAADELARRRRETAESELRRLRGERRRMLHKAQTEAASLVDNARRDVERALRQARGRPTDEQARELRKRLAARRQALATGLKQTEHRPASPFEPGELKAGARVWVELLREHGTVRDTADGGRFIVEVGSIRYNLQANQVGRPRDASTPPASRPAAVRHDGPRDAPDEVNLVGLRVEEAVGELAAFLDAAILAGHERVRVIHGRGSGALRKAVHAELDSVGLRAYRLGQDGRDPGGSGVTLVDLGSQDG